MSWDIHGEPLAPGHCEVHPWVHEPYPCGLCIADGRRFEEQQQEEGEYWRAQQEEYWRAQQEEYYAGLQVDEWVAEDLGPVAFAMAGGANG